MAGNIRHYAGGGSLVLAAVVLAERAVYLPDCEIIVRQTGRSRGILPGDAAAAGTRLHAPGCACAVSAGSGSLFLSQRPAHRTALALFRGGLGAGSHCRRASPGSAFCPGDWSAGAAGI